MRVIALILALLAAIAALSSLYTVKETEYAVKFRLGEIVETEHKPGLHWRIPVVHTIRKFDSRILTLDARPERFLTVEKKYVEVDSYVKWRIADVEKFYVATRGDEFTARERLSQIIKDGLRAEFAKRTLNQVVSTKREQIMEELNKLANEKTADFGIQIVDVRVKRINLPDDVSATVYIRMRSERKREANEYRSEGREEAEIIRANADREVTILLAQARKTAEGLRGEGDAMAAAIYADAYGKNSEFYNFHRSLEAYRQSFGGGDNMIIMDPNSPFFKYFQQEIGK